MKLNEQYLSWAQINLNFIVSDTMGTSVNCVKKYKNIQWEIVDIFHLVLSIMADTNTSN